MFESRSRRIILFLVLLFILGTGLGLTANYVSSSRELSAEDLSPQQFSALANSTTHFAVFFSSPTCSNCDLMRPVWQSVSAKYDGYLKFREVSYSLASSGIFEKYDVYSTPVFIIFSGGINVSRHDGVFSSSSTMNQFVQTALTEDGNASDSEIVAMENELALSSNSPSLVISFVLGLSVFASPCVLPLLPGYLGFILSRRKASRGKSSIATFSSFLMGATGILAVGVVFVILGNLFWSLVADGKLLISLGLMALGLAALLNIGIISRTPSILNASSWSSTRFIRGVSAYSLVYGVLSLGCNLPFMVGAILNIIGGVDLLSMTLRLVMFAVGFALPLSVLTFVSVRGASLSAEMINRSSVLIQKLGALTMIAASVLMIVFI